MREKANLCDQKNPLSPLRSKGEFESKQVDLEWFQKKEKKNNYDDDIEEIRQRLKKRDRALRHFAKKINKMESIMFKGQGDSKVRLGL